MFLGLNINRIKHINRAKTGGLYLGNSDSDRAEIAHSFIWARSQIVYQFSAKYEMVRWGALDHLSLNDQILSKCFYVHHTSNKQKK